MRSLLLLILTLVAWPIVKGFDVHWFSVPKHEVNEIYDEPVDEEIPPPVIRPADRSWKTQYRFYNDEDNRVCAKFNCEKRPCCEGMCIQILNAQLCVKFPFNLRRKRK